MSCGRGTAGGWRRAGDERGSVLVEFSLVFALFVLVIYALITFGVILSAKNSLTHAAAEGARSAIGVVDDPATPLDERVTRATGKVGDSLSWMGSKYQPGDTSATVAGCANSPAECITVTIEYPYDARPIVPPAPGLGLVTPSKLKSTAVVELSN